MSDVNPNVQVAAEPTVAAAPGEAVSFEAVEAVMEARASAAKTEKKEDAKVAEKAADKAVKKVLDAKSEEEQESRPAEDGAPKEADGKPSGKPIRAFVGGKEVELDPDAEIEWRVDGKPERFKLSDLAGQGSGRVAYDRKFNELSKQRKQFEEQVKTVNTHVDRILKLSQDNPVGAIVELARLAGKTPDEYIKTFEGVMGSATSWGEMSASERQAMMSQIERDHYKTELERRKQADAEAQRRQEVEKQMADLTQVLGASSEEISALADEAKGYVKDGEVGPAHVQELWACKQVHKAFDDVAPDVLKQDPDQFGEVVRAVMAHGVYDAEDIRDIVRQAYTDESARRVSKKMQSSQAKAETRRESERSSKNIVSFDQL